MVIPNPEYGEMTVTKENIAEFIETSYRRQIRNSAAARIHGDLINGVGIKNPIHVNIRDGKMRTIDGNHRIDAVGRFLKGGPDKEVPLKLAKYFDLTDEQEKALYDELATVVNQTINDFLKIHLDEIPIAEMIDNNFPVAVSLYSSKDALRFQTLFVCWGYRENAEYGTGGPRKKQFLETLKSYGREDYDEMKTFFKRFREIFGLPTTMSPYYKTGTLWIIMSIYFRNKGVVDREELWEQMKKRLFMNGHILEVAKTHGYAFASEKRRIIMESSMNKGWRGSKLI